MKKTILFVIAGGFALVSAAALAQMQPGQGPGSSMPGQPGTAAPGMMQGPGGMHGMMHGPSMMQGQGMMPGQGAMPGQRMMPGGGMPGMMQGQGMMPGQGMAPGQGMMPGQMMPSQGMAPGGGFAGRPKGDDSPASLALNAINLKMHAAMDIALTGNTDVDFARAMIPHHQGAIDMAKVVIAFGKDPEIRKLAEAIVKAQTDEIGWMQDWLGKNAR
jgi:uncharacterized protein (DUF305 family)